MNALVAPVVTVLKFHEGTQSTWERGGGEESERPLSLEMTSIEQGVRLSIDRDLKEKKSFFLGGCLFKLKMKENCSLMTICLSVGICIVIGG